MNKPQPNWDNAFKNHKVITTRDGWNIIERVNFFRKLSCEEPRIYVAEYGFGCDYGDWIVGSIYKQYSWAHSLNKDERVSLAKWCASKVGDFTNYEQHKDNKLKELGVYDA
jgi:hypothetical protein